MKTIQRIYIYLTALIALEVMVWGGASLLQMAVDNTGSVQTLASRLAQVITGALFFAIHWRFIQKDSLQPEGRHSWIRALFLYLSIAIMLIPVIQTVLFYLEGSGHNWWNWPFNLMAAYFIYQVLHADWQQPETGKLQAVRQWVLYLWQMYGLGLLLTGLYKLLGLAADILFRYNTAGHFRLGIFKLLIGLFIWAYVTWQIDQILSRQTDQRAHPLRQILYYGLVLVAALTIFGTLQVWLSEFITSLASPGNWGGMRSVTHDVLPPFLLSLLVGGYYHSITRQDSSLIDPASTRTARDLLTYILSAVGLIAVLIGGLQAISLFVQTLEGMIFNATRFGTMISAIVLGGLLWGLLWQGQTQKEAHSLIKRIYLYLMVLIGTIGLMVSIVDLLRMVLLLLLGRGLDIPAWTDLLGALLDSLLFAALIFYHAVYLRDENQWLNAQTAQRLSDLKIMIASPQYDALAAFLQAKLPEADIQPFDTPLPGQTDILIAETFNVQTIELPADSQTLTFVLPPQHREGLYWLGQTSTRQEILAQLPDILLNPQQYKAAKKTSVWKVFGYIILGIIGLQVLIALLNLAFGY